jgi:hypothetical protein
MIRPFVVLFKHNAQRTELMALPDLPPFLVSVLTTINSETFFVVCWAIVTVEVPDFFRRRQ